MLAAAPATAPAAPPVELSSSLLVSDSSGTTLSVSKISLSVVTLSRSSWARTWVTAMPGPSVAASIASRRLCTLRSYAPSMARRSPAAPAPEAPAAPPSRMLPWESVIVMPLASRPGTAIDTSLVMPST